MKKLSENELYNSTVRSDTSINELYMLYDNIGDLVPLYRCFGTAHNVASSGASRPLGGAAPLGVFHRVRPSAVS